jgi:hypothetical protein
MGLINNFFMTRDGNNPQGRVQSCRRDHPQMTTITYNDEPATWNSNHLMKIRLLLFSDNSKTNPSQN